jgi:hypothetical protein
MRGAYLQPVSPYKNEAKKKKKCIENPTLGALRGNIPRHPPSSLSKKPLLGPPHSSPGFLLIPFGSGPVSDQAVDESTLVEGKSQNKRNGNKEHGTDGVRDLRV